MHASTKMRSEAVMRIVFIGPPGAGKGTQAQRVSKHYSIPHVSTGDTLRDATQGNSPLGKIAAQQINAGNLVPDDVVLGIVRERLAEPDCANGVLLDGFPRTQQQAQSLDEDLKSSGIALDVVLALDVEDGEIRQRLVDRARGPDDNPETIQHRLDVYHSQTKPILSYYRDQGLLRTVSGIGSVDEVFQRVVDSIDSASANRPVE
jgi:adenylate kinase